MSGDDEDCGGGGGGDDDHKHHGDHSITKNDGSRDTGTSTTYVWVDKPQEEWTVDDYNHRKPLVKNEAYYTWRKMARKRHKQKVKRVNQERLEILLEQLDASPLAFSYLDICGVTDGIKRIDWPCLPPRCDPAKADIHPMIERRRENEQQKVIRLEKKRWIVESVFEVVKPLIEGLRERRGSTEGPSVIVDFGSASGSIR